MVLRSSPTKWRCLTCWTSASCTAGCATRRCAAGPHQLDAVTTTAELAVAACRCSIITPKLPLRLPPSACPPSCPLVCARRHWQDEATCCAIGQKSYNELVMQLVTTLGDAATPKCVTPSGSFRAPPAAVGPAAPAAATPEQQQQAGGAAVAAQGAAGAPPPATRGAQPINADMLAAALQSSLRVDAPAAGPSSGAGEATPPQPVAASPLGSSITGTTSLTHSESMRRMIDDMMSGLVKVRSGRGLQCDRVEHCGACTRAWQQKRAAAAGLS